MMTQQVTLKHIKIVNNKRLKFLSLNSFNKNVFFFVNIGHNVALLKLHLFQDFLNNISIYVVGLNFIYKYKEFINF